MEEQLSVGDEDKDGDVEGGVVDGVIEGDMLMLGNDDEDGVWLRDGTADGTKTNGRRNRAASIDMNPPPFEINTPFDLIL
mmetsp:Transcript_39317/g.70823  ORF Transcript_39317/g.70823 Transcript_39317/m.70823 type:complete len:80 (+) Transcript_39317:876-1115(+)